MPVCPGRAVSQIWSACKLEASTSVVCPSLPVCPTAPHCYLPVWSLHGQPAGTEKGKTRRVLAVLRCAAKPPTRGFVYSLHKVLPTTLRRPHLPLPGQPGDLSVSEPQAPLSFASYSSPILACSHPVVLPTPAPCSLTPVLAAAVSGLQGVLGLWGGPCGGLCPYPAKKQPKHLPFDFDVGPNPKPCMLSFKLFGNHGVKRLGTAGCTWVVAISLR